MLQPLSVAFILACFHLPNAKGDLNHCFEKCAGLAPPKIGHQKVGFIICLPAPSEAPAKVIKTNGWGLSKYHSTMALDTSKNLSTHEKILKGILGLLSSQRSEAINEIYKKYVIAILLSISPTTYVRLPGTNSQIALSEKKHVSSQLPLDVLEVLSGLWLHFLQLSASLSCWPIGCTTPPWGQ